MFTHKMPIAQFYLVAIGILTQCFPLYIFNGTTFVIMLVMDSPSIKESSQERSKKQMLK